MENKIILIQKYEQRRMSSLDMSLIPDLINPTSRQVILKNLIKYKRSMSRDVPFLSIYVYNNTIHRNTHIIAMTVRRIVYVTIQCSRLWF